MSFASETVALLVLATHALGFQTSAAQHALLTPEERKSALRQLMVTVETAGELAKVAHVEALAKHKGVDGDMECKGADPEQLRAEPDNFGREAARAALETKGVGIVGGAGANSTQTVYGRLVEESEMRKEDNEKGDKEVEKSLQDTERIYAMLEKFGNNVDKAMQQMKALNAELEKVKREKLEADGEARKSVAEMEKLRLEINRINNYIAFAPL